MFQSKNNDCLIHVYVRISERRVCGSCVAVKPNVCQKTNFDLGKAESYPLKTPTHFCCLRYRRLSFIPTMSIFKHKQFRSENLVIILYQRGEVKPYSFMETKDSDLFSVQSREAFVVTWDYLFVKWHFHSFNSRSRQIYNQELNRPLTFTSSPCTNHAFQPPSTERVHNKQVPKVELWRINTFQNVLLLQLVAIFKGTVWFKISCQFHQTCWVLYCHCRKWMAEFHDFLFAEVV